MMWCDVMWHMSWRLHLVVYRPIIASGGNANTETGDTFHFTHTLGPLAHVYPCLCVLHAIYHTRPCFCLLLPLYRHTEHIMRQKSPCAELCAHVVTALPAVTSFGLWSVVYALVLAFTLGLSWMLVPDFLAPPLESVLRASLVLPFVSDSCLPWWFGLRDLEVRILRSSIINGLVLASGVLFSARAVLVWYFASTPVSGTAIVAMESLCLHVMGAKLLPSEARRSAMLSVMAVVSVQMLPLNEHAALHITLVVFNAHMLFNVLAVLYASRGHVWCTAFFAAVALGSFIYQRFDILLREFCGQPLMQFPSCTSDQGASTLRRASAAVALFWLVLGPSCGCLRADYMTTFVGCGDAEDDTDDDDDDYDDDDGYDDCDDDSETGWDSGSDISDDELERGSEDATGSEDEDSDYTTSDGFEVGPSTCGPTCELDTETDDDTDTDDDGDSDCDSGSHGHANDGSAADDDGHDAHNDGEHEEHDKDQDDGQDDVPDDGQDDAPDDGPYDDRDDGQDDGQNDGQDDGQGEDQDEDQGEDQDDGQVEDQDDGIDAAVTTSL